jgi:hypothetical protein
VGRSGGNGPEARGFSHRQGFAPGVRQAETAAGVVKSGSAASEGEGSDVAGIGIFNASVEEVDRLMRDDPAVKEGVLLYELHSCRSFPGDQLPK